LHFFAFLNRKAQGVRLEEFPSRRLRVCDALLKKEPRIYQTGQSTNRRLPTCGSKRQADCGVDEPEDIEIETPVTAGLH
jgi:hypothetical protein